MFKITSKLAAILTSSCFSLVAANPENPSAPKDQEKKEANIGEVVVITSEKEVLEHVHTRVTANTIEALNANNVFQALFFLPGISFQMNTRGERVIYMRGNDSRRVPVYLDGIASYVPYNGSVDYGHLSAFDIEEIQVAKGFSSVIYGPNTLGGAINLVTKKPTEAFQGDALLGFADGNGKKTAVNIGSRLERFYIQGGGSIFEQGDFRLSSNFMPTSRQDGGRRKNSDISNAKASAKIGFTPSNGECVIGYMLQKGEKGVPLASEISERARYWRWPNWDKDNVYFLSHTAIGSHGYIKVRAYHDTYIDIMHVFTDNTYSQLAASGGISKYDDFTNGAQIEFGTTVLKSHNIRAMIQTKRDVHRSNSDLANPNSVWRKYRDELSSLGIEDSITVNEKISMTLGLAIDRQKVLETGVYDKVGSQTFLQAQLGAFWKITNKIQTYVTIAKKGKFPTLSDRYSTAYDRFAVNPDLRSEQSMNYDIGVKSPLLSWLNIEGAVFYSDITDLIETIVIQTSPTLEQKQNVGKARHQGVELSFNIKPSSWSETGIFYTYLHRENLSAPGVRLRNVPKSRITGFTKIVPVSQFYLMASVESQDTFWRNDTARIAGYTVANLTLGYTPTKSWLIDAGFTNILDKDYQQSFGYPLPGRAWFANTRYRF